MTVERDGYPPVEMGLHAVQREGPLVHVAIRGHTSLAEMQAIVRVYEAALDESGYLLILLDMTDAGGLNTPARKYVTDFVKAHTEEIAAAVYGASFSLRITLELISRSVRALSRRTIEVTFHASEVECRRYLAAQVPRLRAQR
ncbi:hypothetical protein [Polyangium mundeleinium]|uniref:STAS/SEC14 domain-containing protein n=1 Tax=Polyangium mundeleinium TaxID=2995306 RepID=A0ABT5EVS4_9BACT|nr:hypothetical protein [Polyangium mundeleinium]MDC0745469.1 hypothetical protein [Polyangium mundeleinium]